MSLTAFETACSFLTRFGRARIVSAKTIAEAAFWYPLVGLLLGTLGYIIVWLCISTLSNYISLWSIAWFYVLFNLWITRAMHWDGLADLSDGLGSNVTDKIRFWQITTDSRLGVYGCLSLVSVFSGMIIATYGNILQQNYIILLLAPFLSRAFCLFFTRLASPYTSESLSGAIYPGVALVHLLFWAFVMLCFLLIMFSFTSTIIFLAACCALMIYLAKIAKNNGGFNGDFLGTVIVITELIALGILR